jgi:hypothetical protein
MKDTVQEFESLNRDDPLAARDPTAVRKLEQARETFVSRMQTTDTYASARNGILPPGVSTKTWFDDDNAWSYGMSVYVPSLTNTAAEAAREMRESRPLQPIDDGAGRRTGTPAGDSSRIRRPGEGVGPGVTGKVSPDDDL